MTSDPLAQPFLPGAKRSAVITEHSIIDEQFQFVATFGVDESRFADPKSGRIEFLRSHDVDDNQLLLQRTQNLQVGVGLVEPPVTDEDQKPPMRQSRQSRREGFAES